MEHWYLLRSKSRQEKRAELNLANQGYSSYWPMVAVNKSKTIVPRLVMEPLFPGYLFVRLDCDYGDWNALRSTRGVVDFVRFGSYPAKVPDGLVELLQESVPSIEIGLSRVVQFREGDSVIIRSGCLKGLNAIFQCEKGSDRALVLVSIVGANTEVLLDKAVLEKTASTSIGMPLN